MPSPDWRGACDSRGVGRWHRDEIVPLKAQVKEGLSTSVRCSYTVKVIHGTWPAPGSEDTELGVLMELEVGHGETEVYPRVQA